jgi:hypothetical protein
MRRRKPKRQVFQTPFGRRVGDVALMAVLFPIAAAAAGLVLAAAVAAATSRPAIQMAAAAAAAVAVLWLAFRSRGWPA